MPGATTPNAPQAETGGATGTDPGASRTHSIRRPAKRTRHAIDPRGHAVEARTQGRAAPASGHVARPNSIVAALIVDHLAVVVAPDDIGNATRPELREIAGHEPALLAAAGIRVSLFVDPDADQLRAAAECGAPVVELHTGAYADATGAEQEAEFDRLLTACHAGHELGLQINAGHGLNLDNVRPVARLPYMTELNIGHAIVARAIFVGLEAAVVEMKAAVQAP